ncbi:MAG: hypothetical protein ABI592_11200 [Acidobacteriota bacterium]
MAGTAGSFQKEYPMARSRMSAKTMRNLAPVLIPLVTRVAIPMAVRSFKGKNGAREAFEDTRDQLGKNLKRTRSEFDDIRDEAIDRGQQLYGEALKHGTELLDMLAAKGVNVAEDWSKALKPRRRGFPFGKMLAVVAVVGLGVALYNNR